MENVAANLRETLRVTQEEAPTHLIPSCATSDPRMRPSFVTINQRRAADHRDQTDYDRIHHSSHE